MDGSAGGFGGQGGADFSDIFGDVFGDIFGGGGRRQQGPAPGADLRYQMELSLEEAVRGVEKKIRIPTMVGCKACSGTGAKKAPNPALARPVMVTARFACNKDFLGSTNLSTLPWARPSH